MFGSRRRILAVLALAALCSASVGSGRALLAAQTAEGEAMERGRALTGWLLAGPVDSLDAHLSDDFRTLLGGADGLELMRGQLDAQLGREREVVDEEVLAVGKTVHYYRIARFSTLEDGTVTVHWAWRDGGPVVGGQVRPTLSPAPSEHLDYRTRTELRLPFDGEWTVAWGGRSAHRNYHVVAPDQRFAYDFLVLRDGLSHQGDGSRNEDYHCFGQPVLAPADGRVVAAVDSVADNVPGQMNGDAPPGNYVVVDHGEGEHSLLAHLRRGSVAVAVGDPVSRGEPLGECGNSGNSSEPHLHFHLQTGSDFGEGVGLPAFFHGYERDGAPIERGEPVRGQRLRPVR